MIEPFSRAEGFANLSQMNTPSRQTTTWLFDGGAVKASKTGTASTIAAFRKWLPAPMDIRHLFNRKALLKWWHYHATYTDVNNVSVRLIYKLDASGTITSRDIYTLSSLTGAAWNAYSSEIGSPTAAAASEADRRHLIAVDGVVTASSAGATPSDLIWGPCMAVAAAGAEEEALGSLVTFPDDTAPGRIFVPKGFTAWRADNEPLFVVNNAESDAETNFQGQFHKIKARLDAVNIQRDRVGLHAWERFRDYAVRNNDFEVARDWNQLMSTTLDAASGAGQSDPRILNVTHTQHIAWLIDYLGVTNPIIRVGPNAERQTELAQVQEVGTSGASGTVVLRHPLAHAYASGDPLHAADHFSACALESGANPVQHFEDSYSIDLRCREVA